MELHLASSSNAAASSAVLWTIILVVGFVVGWLATVAKREMSKIRGPSVTGTAEVLSLRQFGSIGSFGKWQVCRLRLRVNVPDRAPYEATIWRNIEARYLNAGWFDRGRSIAVDVGEQNPRKIQISLSGTQAGSTTHHVVNLPPKVTFNQSSWSPETGWRGSPPGDIAEQIKAAVEGAFQPNVGQQAEAYRHTGGAGPVLSGAALLATGQRVPAALKSFAPTGTTPRSLGRTPSRPELIDAPHYMLEVELHFPNLAPITGRAVQPVPTSHVPSLGIGLPLTCAVDPADPSHRFVVDWDAPRTL
jgi:hypothetical protein